MSVDREVRACSPREWSTLVAALEAEFLHTRGRKGTLAERYPTLFGGAGVPDAFRLCAAGEEVVSACAIRRFRWEAQALFHGAMIGFVWTAPGHRGQGHAAFLLRSVVDELSAQGLDFAVLWSGLEGFYERLGWQRADPGVFATIPGAPHVPRESPPPPAASSLEALRLASHQPRLRRGAQDWQVVPIPATCVGMFASTDAYLLCGDSNEDRFIYEAHGPQAALAALWPRVAAGMTRVHVNDWTGGPLHAWLAGHSIGVFKPQRLAFWQPLGLRAKQGHWRQWHLPWFDRI